MNHERAIIHPLLTRLRGVLAIAGILVSTSVVLGFLGRFAWWLDLFSHFRAQYLILFAVLCPTLWVLRQRKTSLLFLLIACVNFLPMSSLCLGGQKSLPHGLPVLRAMLLNVNTSFGDPERVRQAIQEENPDLLVLEEINVRWMSDLVWLKKPIPSQKLS